MKRNTSIAILLVQILLAGFTLTGIAIGSQITVRHTAGNGSPSILSYQGRVNVDGAPFCGVGFFKFAIVDSTGMTTYWSNDGTSTVGDAPNGAVVLTVNNGLFTVLLGDVVPRTNMTQPLTAAVFSTPERSLRVWFSSDSGKNFTQLSPDTRLASVPYALQAEQALQARVADNADYRYYPLLPPQQIELTSVDPGLKNFSGGFTDGNFVYLTPNKASANTYSGLVTRIDTCDFSTAGVDFYDLADVESDLKGFSGGFTDGRFGYFVPNGVVPLYGKIARVDLNNFTIAGVQWIDLTSIDSELKGFEGGFTDGRYGYLVPNTTGSGPSGKIVRLDLENFSVDSTSVLDLGAGNSNLRGFSNGFTDGRYGYFAPKYRFVWHGYVARVDLLDFSPGGVSWVNLGAGHSQLVGFSGGFTDGRYGYFTPLSNNSRDHGKVARVDLQNFSSSGLEWIDMAAGNSNLRGFWGGFSDGRYGYFVPDNNWTTEKGVIARIQLFNGVNGP